MFDVRSDQEIGKREVELNLKPRARTLGVTLDDLARQVRAAFFGSEAVRVQRGREEVRVYVRLPKDERSSLADIRRSEHRWVIYESCPTKIFLPNPEAATDHVRDLYQEIGLNSREIETVASGSIGGHGSHRRRGGRGRRDLRC